jgi:hypothetical protein
MGSMATRTIVTSQPGICCDMCERTLLRGEQHDVFIAAGRRLTVCELCASQAVLEGWTRESEVQAATLPPARPRRGRSLVERLVGSLGRRDETLALADRGEPVAPVAPVAPVVPVARRRRAAAVDPDVPAWLSDAGTDVDAEELQGDATHAQPTFLEVAVEVFNASEFPRRIAGVARSLGTPEVSVRSAEHLASVVRIVVAWELSWYRYEVDLSEPPAEARLLAQGSELSELERGERIGNAVADAAGALGLRWP